MNSFSINNRRYLGSKTKLISFIEEVIQENCPNVEVIADLFAGTGVVSYSFAKKGKQMIVNDLLYSNYISFQTWFGSEKVNEQKLKGFLEEFNNFRGENEEYVSGTFGNRYFTEENAKIIGEVRQKIEDLKEANDVNDREYAYLLTSLLYAMDKVANTVGHYDAYRKKMSANQRIEFKYPDVELERSGHAIYQKDANLLAREVQSDLTYIDPPYNSRQYGDAYHLLENIMEWKKPPVEGIARKMKDRKSIKSDYSTTKAPDAFRDLVGNLKTKYILVSYNNMPKGNTRSASKISSEEILAILEERGPVEVFEKPYQVFNTGKTNINNHKEVLYLCKVKNNSL